MSSMAITHAGLVVGNGSFENPDIPDTDDDGIQSFADVDASPWEGSDANNATGATSVQLCEEGSGTTLSANGLSATDGNQVVRLIEEDTDGDNVILQQNLGTVTQDEIDTLALQYDIGREDGNEIPVTSLGFIFNSDGETSGTWYDGLAAPDAGTFETRTVSLSDTDISAGDEVEIRFVARQGDYLSLGSADPNDGIDGTADRQRVYFDNVALVPEPGSSSLLLFGVAMLSFYRKRKQN